MSRHAWISAIVFSAIMWGLIFCAASCNAEEWTATSYCSCSKCCGKSDGITASGKPANNGTIACNWLPFGTVLYVDGKRCVVQDRGAKSIFGDKQHHIKRLDIWMPTHKQALQYGRRTVNVVIAD